MTKSYYKVLDGERYDRQMIEIAEEAVAGQGDGRISISDVEILYEAIIDGNTITEIEEKTLTYIRENFRFTAAADDWLTKELEAWIARKGTDGTISQENEGDEEPSDLASETIYETREIKSEKTKLVGVDKTQHLPHKSSTIQESKPVSSSSGIWKGLAIVFLLLLPIAFFIGKNLVTNQENPEFKATQAGLEAKLRSNNQNLVAAKAEIVKLKNQLASQNVSQVPATTQATNAEEGMEETGSKLSKEIAAALRQSLSSEFQQQIIQVDEKRLVITLLPEQSFFESGGILLKPVLKDSLRKIFPKFVQTLKTFDAKIAEIQFQGHSSSNWRLAKDGRDAYLKNLGLSIARAEATLKYCLDLKEVEESQSWLIKRMTSTGVSGLRPVFNQDKTEDEVRSRRISIAIIVDGE